MKKVKYIGIGIDGFGRSCSEDKRYKYDMSEFEGISIYKDITLTKYTYSHTIMFRELLKEAKKLDGEVFEK